MITCRDLVDLLVDFVSGELDPERQAHIREHLQKCPPCVVYLETYQVTIRLTRRLPCDQLPSELEQKLREAVARHGGPGPASQSPPPVA
jgi:anti-sigma factor RsiW